VSAANTPISLEFSNDVRVAMIIISVLLDLMMIAARGGFERTIDCSRGPKEGDRRLDCSHIIFNFSMSGCHHIDPSRNMVKEFPRVVEKEKKKGKRGRKSGIFKFNFYFFLHYFSQDAIFEVYCIACRLFCSTY